MDNISAFADCSSNTVSIRIPSEFVVEILNSLEDSEYKQELLKKLEFSARRCKSLAEALKNIAG
mgnify:CR=1 FL=1